MKKIISTVLLLAMVLSLLAGCTLVPTEPSATLEDAKKFLVNYFIGFSATTDVDYKIPGTIKVNETVFNVVWTTDNENIKVVPQEDGKVLIDLPELSAEEVTYVLTATITLDGKDGEITYSRTCKMSASAAAGKTQEEIVEEIYQLPDSKKDENAATMEGVTLTGKVIAINAAYSEGKGITVIMQIGNLTDKPITAYQMKVAAGEAELSAALATMLPGDTITVSGTVKNYGGTYEFDKGCLMTAYTKGETVTAPTDPAQILADALALAPGYGLPYNATLTGTVTSIGSNYDAGYNNITVTIKIGDAFIQCYRLVGSEGANIAIGDTITVTGPIMNYKGNIQFVESSTLVSRTTGEGGGNTELELPENAVLKVSGVYITGTEYLYTGKNKLQLVASADLAKAIAFTIIKNADNTYSFKTNDGYFLFCDATDVKFATEESDYTKFVLELTNGGYYIKCATATYNNNAQYLEYYSNYLTCYSMGSDPSIYTFTLEDATGANGTVVKYVADDNTGDDTTDEIPENAVLKISGVYITGTEYLYTGKNKLQLVTSANIADAIAFTIIKNADNTYSFKTNDGYFLFCDATDVKFVTEEGDYTKFVLEATDGGYFIKCAVANYSGKAQYLEYYSNYLTSFGMGNDTTIYTFALEDTTGANGTVVKYVADDNTGDDNTDDDNTDEPGTGTQPENPGTDAPTIADGNYVLWTPADNKAMEALAADKNYGYAPSSNVTLANGVLTGYTNNNIFTVVNNGDGTFKLYDIHGRLVHMSGTHNSFQVAADAASVTEGANWTLTAADNGCFIITNVDKQKTFHYSSSFGTFESVNTASTPMMLTAVEKITEPDPDEPENPGTQPENPGVSNNHFDFSAVNSSYGSYTSASGWVAVNSAIQGGGSDQAKDNKYFSAIGADDSTKAVCLNGKTSAVGKLTSPTLSGGISKLTFNYGIMFGDNKVGVTIKITDSNGVSQTTTLSDTTMTKYAVETFTWTLDTAVSGDFTIEITNTSPSASASSNKDRISIWNIDWEA